MNIEKVCDIEKTIVQPCITIIGNWHSNERFLFFVHKKLYLYHYHIFITLNFSRKSLIKSKHGLAISAIEPSSPEIIKNNDVEGKICLNIKPGSNVTLKLKINNSNPIENQTVDDDGQKLGLVIKSIEFLRYDPNFELTGMK